LVDITPIGLRFEAAEVILASFLNDALEHLATQTWATFHTVLAAFCGKYLATVLQLLQLRCFHLVVISSARYVTLCGRVDMWRRPYVPECV